MSSGKPNIVSVDIYPLGYDAATTVLSDDGSSPAFYPAVEASTNANTEAAPGVAWVRPINFEQNGSVNLISIYVELEWQTRFVIGAGGGVNSISKMQISRDGGTTWVDVTDKFTNHSAVMAGIARAGVGLWIPTIAAGLNQLQLRLVHWTDDGGGVATSKAQVRSNSHIEISYRKA